ncbi:hypothetical protein DVH05_004895 [Phytophthora capsici]|nr:hypothetical protein DVH05_004895 [Phytophthora capsici]
MVGAPRRIHDGLNKLGQLGHCGGPNNKLNQLHDRLDEPNDFPDSHDVELEPVVAATTF